MNVTTHGRRLCSWGLTKSTAVGQASWLSVWASPQKGGRNRLRSGSEVVEETGRSNTEGSERDSGSSRGGHIQKLERAKKPVVFVLPN